MYTIREHLAQSLQTLQFLQNVRKPSLKEIDNHSVALPPSKCIYTLILVPMTIVLDLDETLIHCNESLNIPHDVSLNIKFPTG